MSTATIEAQVEPRELNFCARMQIGLAQLRLFPQSCDVSALSPDMAEAAIAACEKWCRQLGAVGLETTWLHPPLLRALADALEQFPWGDLATVLRKAGRDLAPGEMLKAGIDRRAPKWRMVADQLDSLAPNSLVLELARMVTVSAAAGGASQDEVVFRWLANTLALNTTERLSIRQQLVAWATETQARAWNASQLLASLLRHCTALRPAHHILADYVDRLQTTVYLPLVFETPTTITGVCIPIRIEAEFNTPCIDPIFTAIEFGTTQVIIDPEFKAAIIAGRSLAYDLLRRRQCPVPIRNYSLNVFLTDLRLIDHSTIRYNQGSIELPLALAIFCNHPLIRRLALPNPKVVCSGPVRSAESVAAKLVSLASVGGTSTLLVSSDSTGLPAFPGLCIQPPHDHHALLKSYFIEEDWDALNKVRTPVISFSTDRLWNEPLTTVGGGRNRPALLRTLKNHDRALTALLRKERAIQVKGLTGTGKTYLIAQWLNEHHHEYDTVLHTCIPPYGSPRDVKPWWDRAILDFASRLAAMGFRDLETVLKSHVGLMTNPEGTTAAIMAALPGRVLIVIDNAQECMSSESSLLDPRLEAMLSNIRAGIWRNAQVMLITTREFVRPDLAVYPSTGTFPLGFTAAEARQFLLRSEWQYHALTAKAVRVLSGHPKALELLVSFASTRGVKDRHVSELLDTLPDAWEAHLRSEVYGRILSSMLRHLSISERQSLELASTFLDSFDDKDFVKAATHLMPRKAPVVQTLSRSLPALVKRSLVDERSARYVVHGLVRDYVQDRTTRERPDTFRALHKSVARVYYRAPPRNASSEDSDFFIRPELAAKALYHFEKANDTRSQHFILRYLYDTEIASAKWLLEYSGTSEGESYRLAEAERLLRHAMRVYATSTRDNSFPGAEESPPDLNLLMAEVLVNRKANRKLPEASFHLEQAWKKGTRAALAPLVCVSCEIAATADPTKRAEAADRAGKAFSHLRAQISEWEAEPLRTEAGKAFEAFARLTATLRPIDLEPALNILDEAVRLRLYYEGCYSCAAELLRSAGRTQEIAPRLEEGLRFLPDSITLWRTYVVFKASSEEFLNTMPADLFRFQRSISAVVAAARALLKEQRFTAALEYLETVRTAYEHAADLWLCYGDVHRAMRDARKAEACYWRAIDCAPGRIDVYAALGAFLAHAHRTLEAEKIYGRGLRYEPRWAEGYRALAQLWAAEGESRKAINVYRQALTVLSRWRDGWLELARLYASSDMASVAVEILAKQLERDKRWKAGYLRLARLYSEAGTYSTASDVIQLGLKFMPRWTNGHYELGEILRRQGKVSAARDEYYRALAISDHDRSVRDRSMNRLLGIADEFETSGDLDGAVVTYGRIRSVQPLHVHACKSLAELLVKKGATEEGIAILESVRSSDGKLVRYVLIQLGRLYRDHGSLPAALEVLNECVERFPDFGDARTELARTQFESGQHTDAVETLRFCVSSLQEYLPAYDELYRLCSSLGDVSGMAWVCEKAAVRFPSSAPGRSWRFQRLKSVAEAKAVNGDIDEAISSYSRYLSVASRDQDAYAALARLHGERAEFAKAFRVFLKAVNNCGITDYIGTAIIAMMDRCATAMAGDTVVVKNICDIFALSDTWDSGWDAFVRFCVCCGDPRERAASLACSVKVTWCRSRVSDAITATCSDAAVAAEFYRRAVLRKDAHESWYFELAGLCVTLGQVDEAEGVLRRALGRFRSKTCWSRLLQFYSDVGDRKKLVRWTKKAHQGGTGLAG